MLARNAEGLYWMSRYLERAEHLCRLLRLQVEVLVDRPIQEIDFGWTRLYLSLGREPPGGPLTPATSDDYALADAYALADDLTFERANEDSVWTCLALGRENARQMRHLVSDEMWTCLNAVWLRTQPMSLRDIWAASPESFYLATAHSLVTFTGVADATMRRDQGWRFMQLGRYLERAQLMLSLLAAQMHAAVDEETHDGNWSGLLRRYHAFDAYEHQYSVEVRPRHVLDLLVTDKSLPGSLSYSLDAARMELSALDPAPQPSASDAARQIAERLCDLPRQWPASESRETTLQETMLEQAGEGCRELHALIAEAYFNYWQAGQAR